MVAFSDKVLQQGVFLAATSRGLRAGRLVVAEARVHHTRRLHTSSPLLCRLLNSLSRRLLSRLLNSLSRRLLSRLLSRFPTRFLFKLLTRRFTWRFTWRFTSRFSRLGDRLHLLPVVIIPILLRLHRERCRVHPTRRQPTTDRMPLEGPASFGEGHETLLQRRGAQVLQHTRQQ